MSVSNQAGSSRALHPVAMAGQNPPAAGLIPTRVWQATRLLTVV
jgi:hypothetical protein